MGAVKLQAKGGTSSGSSPLTVTFDNPVAAGSVVVVYIGFRQDGTGGRTMAVMDNFANTYNSDSPPQTTSAFARTAVIQSAVIVTGGSSCAVTVTPSGGVSTNFYVVVEEWSGLTGSPFDKQANTTNGFGTAISSGNTAALSQADELVVSALYIDPSVTISNGSGYTAGTNQGFVSSENQVVASTTAVAGTWTGSVNANYGCACATYKIATAPAGVVPLLMQRAFSGAQ